MATIGTCQIDDINLHDVNSIDVKTGDNNGARWVEIVIQGRDSLNLFLFQRSDTPPIDMNFATDTDPKTLIAHKRIT